MLTVYEWFISCPTYLLQHNTKVHTGETKFSAITLGGC